MRILLFFLLSHTLSGQYEFLPVFRHLEGEPLREALQEHYRPGQVLNLGQAKDTIYKKIYLVNDSVECVYTGMTRYLDPSADPSQFLFAPASGPGINLEHIYPRSKGASGHPAVSDMHALAPSRVDVNAARGNDPFNDIDDNETQTWYNNTVSMNSVPQVDLAAWSEDTDTYFEPRESVKGDIARAVMYFYTIYEDEALSADPDYFADMISTLCEWHEADPVDSLEWTRNFRIARYQDDKANPFIIDCALARLYCPELADLCQISSAGEQQPAGSFKVYPTVVHAGETCVVESVIPAFQVYDFKIVDINARLIPTRVDRSDPASVHIMAPLSSGIYFLHITRGHELLFVQRIVVL